MTDATNFVSCDGAATIIRRRIRALGKIGQEIIDMIPVPVSKTTKPHMIDMLKLAGMAPPPRQQCQRYEQLRKEYEFNPDEAVRVVNYEARENGQLETLRGLPNSEFESFGKVRQAVLQRLHAEAEKEQQRAKKRERKEAAMAAQIAMPDDVLDTMTPASDFVAPQVTGPVQALPKSSVTEINNLTTAAAETWAQSALKTPGVHSVQIIVSGEGFRNDVTRYADIND